MSKHKKFSKDTTMDKNSQEVDGKDLPEVEDIENVGDPTESEVEQDPVINDIEDTPDSEIESLKNLLQQKEEELQKEKKDYLFLMADFDNFRKRTIKEKGELIKTGSENVLKSLLPVVDDFERGLEAIKTSDDIQAIKEGMELVYNKFVKFFEQNGVQAMVTTGEDFDPEQHEALTTMPVDDDKKNKIIDTVTKGYTLNGKVIRHAKVVVGN